MTDSLTLVELLEYIEKLEDRINRYWDFYTVGS